MHWAVKTKPDELPDSGNPEDKVCYPSGVAVEALRYA